MKGHTYREFREKVKKGVENRKGWTHLEPIQGERWHRADSFILYRASQLENETELTRERRGRHVYWKLKRK